MWKGNGWGKQRDRGIREEVETETGGGKRMVGVGEREVEVER